MKWRVVFILPSISSGDSPERTSPRETSKSKPYKQNRKSKWNWVRLNWQRERERERIGMQRIRQHAKKLFNSLSLSRKMRKAAFGRKDFLNDYQLTESDLRWEFMRFIESPLCGNGIARFASWKACVKRLIGFIMMKEETFYSNILKIKNFIEQAGWVERGRKSEKEREARWELSGLHKKPFVIQRTRNSE